MTVCHKDGISFCKPIFHEQKNGDYQSSWQPLLKLQGCIIDQLEDSATMVVKELGGYGLFGVEFFVKDNIVFFNEISPRPHDTGLVTLKTQNMSLRL